MAAYIVAICEITNRNENLKKYMVDSAAILHEHGGKYLVRGPAAEILEGDLLEGKIIVISEFPSMAKLNAFVNDETYVNEVAPLREGTGNYNFAVYESTPPTS